MASPSRARSSAPASTARHSAPSSARTCRRSSRGSSAERRRTARPSASCAHLAQHRVDEAARALGRERRRSRRPRRAAARRRRRAGTRRAAAACASPRRADVATKRSTSGVARPAHARRAVDEIGDEPAVERRSSCERSSVGAERQVGVRTVGLDPAQHVEAAAARAAATDRHLEATAPNSRGPGGRRCATRRYGIGGLPFGLHDGRDERDRPSRSAAWIFSRSARNVVHAPPTRTSAVDLDRPGGDQSISNSAGSILGAYVTSPTWGSGSPSRRRRQRVDEQAVPTCDELGSRARRAVAGRDRHLGPGDTRRRCRAPPRRAITHTPVTVVAGEQRPLDRAPRRASAAAARSGG